MKTILYGAALSLLSANALATYSIAACDRDTGECGVAVATHNLAVGASVPFARAGVGAGVSQFETNPVHAKVILDALKDGASAPDALAQALKRDNEFKDGLNKHFRQIGIVSFTGEAAAHTGKESNRWAGHLTKGTVSLQGNGLTSDDVLETMQRAFENAEGPLAQRLLVALEAGHRAGGQKIGVTSAALLVSHPEGWPRDVDLRVDYASPSAIADLRQAYDARRAFDALVSARHSINRGEYEEARESVAKAITLAPEWDRIWLGAARLSEQLDQTELAVKQMCRFKKLNPIWARQLMTDKVFLACPE